MATISTITQAVRIILDHNDVTSSIEGLADVDTLNLDEMIESQIIPSARLVEMIAPESMVDWEDVEGGTLDSENNMFSVELPEGFLRFGRCKLTDWSYGLAELADTESKEYHRQFGEFSGLKASTSRPLAAIVYADASTNMNTLQMFGVTEDSGLEYCTILTEPTIESSAIDIGDALYQPFLYCCAAHVCEQLKDTNKANQMMVVMKNLLGITSKSTTEE